MFAEGEFIKWYEYYNCGTICSGAGYGVILKHKSTDNSYLILKNKQLILQYFSVNNIAKYDNE